MFNCLAGLTTKVTNMFPQKDFPPYLGVFLVSLAPYHHPFNSYPPLQQMRQALDSDNRPGNYLLEKGNYWQPNSQAASQAAGTGNYCP